MIDLQTAMNPPKTIKVLHCKGVAQLGALEEIPRSSSSMEASRAKHSDSVCFYKFASPTLQLTLNWPRKLLFEAPFGIITTGSLNGQVSNCRALAFCITAVITSVLPSRERSLGSMPGRPDSEGSTKQPDCRCPGHYAYIRGNRIGIGIGLKRKGIG